MNALSLGVDLDDLHVPVKEGLRTAAQLAFQAVELGAVAGDVSPESLSGSGRRHLARMVRGLGLDLAALTADTPHLRLSDPATAGERVERTCRIVELAADMGVPVVAGSVGALTDPGTGAPHPLVMESLQRIGEVADARGVSFALRLAQEPGDRAAGVLDTLGCPALSVCLDPAAMVMRGVNPIAAIEPLAEHIRLVHARDGTVGGPQRSGVEAQLGDGDVDLVGFLVGISTADYPGPLVLRRRDSQNPVADLTECRQRLGRCLPPR